MLQLRFHVKPNIYKEIDEINNNAFILQLLNVGLY